MENLFRDHNDVIKEEPATSKSSPPKTAEDVSCSFELNGLRLLAFKEDANRAINWLEDYERMAETLIAGVDADSSAATPSAAAAKTTKEGPTTSLVSGITSILKREPPPPPPSSSSPNSPKEIKARKIAKVGAKLEQTHLA